MEYCHVTGKRCYNYADARAFLNDCRKYKTFRGDKKPKREYLCKFCNTYHITSQIKKHTKKLPAPLKTVAK